MSERAIFAMVAAAVAALLGILIWAIVSASDACTERGGRWELLYYTPVWHGKTMVMQPIYHCVPKRADPSA